MTDSQYLVTLGSKIKELRNTKKITQQDLARLCDFEKASMSRIESGRTNTTILTLLKISKVLEVPLQDLFKE
ncbi:MAG: helix-turn-helix transcriptional regulator [Bacteroidota bacterium]